MSEHNRTLLELVAQRRWASVMRRVETHPNELEATDDEGETVFHIVAGQHDATRQELEVLLHRDELRGPNNRVALFMNFDERMTPLNTACAVANNPELIELLAQSAPRALSMTDNDGWTPLHYLCTRIKRWQRAGEAIHAILKCIRQEGDVHLAFVKDRMFLNSPLELMCTSVYFVLVGGINAFGDDDECWEHVKSFYIDLGIGNESWPLLKRILTFEETPQVVSKLALCFCKDDLDYVSEEGDTILHTLVSQPSWDPAIHTVVSHPSWDPVLVEWVVWACPDATTRRNSRGMLPLQLARNYGWNRVHQALLEANPLAIEAFRFNDAMYPPIFARVAEPSLIFNILLSRPTVARTDTRGKGQLILITYV